MSEAMETKMNLGELKAGESCVVDSVGGEGALRQHFLDMGIIPGAEITIVKFAPMGDPVEVRIHGYELTLRLDDAKKIAVHMTPKKPEDSSSSKRKKPKTAHPNLGEPGIHHDKKHENPLPDDHVLTFALVGNQNSGKTTLFNRLTGSNQHVGNFPGVTVDRKDGAIIGHPNTKITDLPGIYSMSPYSKEEIVSRDFVLDEKPDAIINIVDSTNIERNLYLTMQLLETDRPVVVALNMMDELTGNGGSVDINMMEQILGVPVVPISAAKNQGVDELIKHVDILMKHELKNALINLNTSISIDKNTKVDGNINSLVQVINNIISNAIQAYDGKPNENINLSLSKKGNLLEIAIQDFAGGLPKDVEEKLFKEMVTTKGKNGTGLGLFMSYSNIKAHFNGNLRYETKLRKGTTFFIEIPIQN